MQKLFVALIAAWRFLVFDATASTGEFVVTWRCDQTYETTVPLRAEIKINLDRASGKIISPDLDALFAQLDKEEYLDFFDCLMAFNAELYGHWFARSFLTGFYTVIAEYGAKAFKKGAVSPFEPGGASQSTIDSKAEKELSQKIGDTCLLPNVVNDKRLLDGGFISRTLPKVVKGIRGGRLEIVSSYDEKNCMESIAERYRELLLGSVLGARQCKANPEGCKKRNQSVQRVVNGLAAIEGLSEYFSKINDDISHCLPDMEDPTQEFVKFMKSTLKGGRCFLLKPGQSRWISREPLKSFPIIPKYTLSRLDNTRDGSPEYKATIEVGFFPDVPGVDVPDVKDTFKEEFHLQYLDKAKGCLSKIQDKLRGPNGEILTIELAGGKLESANGWSSFNIVLISDDEIRASAMKWSRDTDCFAIIHELFHLLGLVDEYEERTLGVEIDADGRSKVVESKEGKFADFPVYNCRILGPDDSIMSGPEDAIKGVFAGKTVSVCQCVNANKKIENYSPATAAYLLPKLTEKLAKETGDEKKKCLGILEGISSNSDQCPEGTRKVALDITVSELEEEKFYRDLMENAERGEPDPLIWAKAIGISEKKVRKSILYPAQFRAIIESGCDSNAIYYSCAQDSYRSSHLLDYSSYGEGRGCRKGLPKECGQGGAAWLK